MICVSRIVLATIPCNGAKLEVISKILGHSSIAITADVYRTVKQDEIQQEHDRFSPVADR